jgi:hypothetical protein
MTAVQRVSPANRADQAAEQPQQQEPAKSSRLDAKRDCRPAAAFVSRQRYQLTGESFLHPDPQQIDQTKQTDHKRRKPRDPRHAPSLTDDHLLERGAAE